MRLYEISSTDDALARALASVNRSNNNNRSDPDAIAAKQAKDAETAEKGKQIRAKRAKIADAAGALAAKASTFDEFVGMAQHTIPASELSWIDLRHTYDTYNPEEKEKSARGWEDYGKQRDAGKTQGIGSGGKRNWTGD